METELLVESSRPRKLSKRKLTVIVLCIFGVAALVGGIAATVRSRKSHDYFKKSECFVPQYDRNGKLTNESVPCSSVMGNVFTSQYLHDTDIYNPTMKGMKIFKPFPNSCFKSQELRITKTKVDNYINSKSFYHKVASDTKVDLSIADRFTMGATLNVKTESLSAGKKDVMGSSIEILTHTRSISLDENCYKSSSSSLTNDVLEAFDALPEIISKPWLGRSWLQYDLFFERFGTHFRTEVLMGSSLRQWSFAVSSESLKIRALRVKACLDLLGPESSIIELTFKACSDITDEEFAKYSYIATYDHLEIRGGTDSTRNALQKLQGSKTSELIEKLLNEGREMEFPITYKYQSIWDVFLIKYANDMRRLRIAENMKHYYMGYKDYGCTHIEIHGISARSFRYVNDDTTSSWFECVLVPQGCQSNDDCHGDLTSILDSDAFCYGDTCFEYENPPFGTKAELVSVRSRKKGEGGEGLNKGCFYRDGDTKCFNKNEKTVVWNIEGAHVVPTPDPDPHPQFNKLYLIPIGIVAIIMLIMLGVWRYRRNQWQII